MHVIAFDMQALSELQMLMGGMINFRFLNGDHSGKRID